MVTAAQKIIKNSNHLYVRNVLHIKLVKSLSLLITTKDKSAVQHQFNTSHKIYY